MGYTGLTLKLGKPSVLTNFARAQESPRVGDSNSIQNLKTKHHAPTVQSEEKGLSVRQFSRLVRQSVSSLVR